MKDIVSNPVPTNLDPRKRKTIRRRMLQKQKNIPQKKRIVKIMKNDKTKAKKRTQIV